MNPFIAVLLSIIGAITGLFIGIPLASLDGGMICGAIITMGACIIYTINKRSDKD